MSETAKTIDNGVKVDALVAAREALTNAPAAAQFKWRAACQWKNGTHSHSTVESFYGLGEEQRRFGADARAACLRWGQSYPEDLERYVRRHLRAMGAVPEDA